MEEMLGNADERQTCNGTTTPPPTTNRQNSGTTTCMRQHPRWNTGQNTLPSKRLDQRVGCVTGFSNTNTCRMNRMHRAKNIDNPLVRLCTPGMEVRFFHHFSGTLATMLRGELCQLSFEQKLFSARQTTTSLFDGVTTTPRPHCPLQ